jgi:hypothetical protein
VPVSKTSLANISGRDLLTTMERYHGLDVKLTSVHFTGGGETRTLTLPDFSDQVARGCKLLDEIEPGWESRVDPTLLDLDDKTTCVLGQVYRNASTLPGYDYKVSTFMAEQNLDAAAHGFDLTMDQRRWVSGTANYNEERIIPLISQTWEHLTATWADVIRERQMARSLHESNVPG